MFAAPYRVSFLLSISLLCGSVSTQAQIHEEKPAPGLEVGVLAHFEKQGQRNQLPAAGKVLGTGDFSVVCRLVLPADLSALTAPVAIVNGENKVATPDQKTDWSLSLAPDRSLSFTAQAKVGGASVKIETLKDAVRPGSAHDIVVSVHRDARQPLSGIWVDGIELASGTFAPMDLLASFPGGNWDVSGWVRSVTVYDRALTRPEIVELNLKAAGAEVHLPKTAHAAPPANGPSFVPQEGETIVLLGGTEAVALAESGEFEAILVSAFPKTHFHFRSLAWEGDTVFKQDRPMNFGSLDQQLRRVNAGTVLVMFGRQECLDRGKAGIPDFKAAFSDLLASIEKAGPRIVVIGPWDFEHKAPPLPDLGDLNQVLIHGYGEAMGESCADHHSLFLNPNGLIDDSREPITRDGVTLTPNGLHFMAEGISLLLNINPDVFYDGHTGNSKLSSALREAVKAKNRLWHDYWRPSNWAFLYGDRTNQPSSRDPVNSQIRLFPSEQETILPMIKAAEEKVYRTAEEMQKRLP